MSLERDRWCPSCEAEQTFYLAASTKIHLGEKRKWTCAECGYGVVQIGDLLDVPSDPEEGAAD